VRLVGAGFGRQVEQDNCAAARTQHGCCSSQHSTSDAADAPAACHSAAKMASAVKNRRRVKRIACTLCRVQGGGSEEGF
jgi:hypothetical protein